MPVLPDFLNFSLFFNDLQLGSFARHFAQLTLNPFKFMHLQVARFARQPAQL